MVRASVLAAVSTAVSVVVASAVSAIGNLLLPLLIWLAPCQVDQHPADPGDRVGGCQVVQT
ncbi:hypothetical protein [Nocardia testacea]|uniref:hypothetical protein n=1 Tax=Nocardia testacea TaxID=248551 RepID=UPI0033E1B45A